ncbi:MAG: DUF3899 domain-containing protein [Firmicutes bacterium]|nr:DUF3899 domain-containing protein [Bacillota bacterium]
MDDRLKLLIKYVCACAVAGLMILVYLKGHQYAEAETLADKYRLICDAFTIPGVVFCLSAALVALVNAGSLDGIGYALSYAVKMLIPGAGLNRETYAEYVERKHEKNHTGYGFLLHVGLVLAAVAVVFLILFNKAYVG